MDKQEIENSILKFYYEGWERHEMRSLENLINDSPQADKRAFEKVRDRMGRDNLLEVKTFGGIAEITCWGVLAAEERQIIIREKVVSNAKIRYKILELAANAEENDENEGFVNSFEMTIDIAQEHSGIDQNLYLLHDAGLIEKSTTALFRITDLGRDNLERWQQHQQIADEYERISQLSPQIRGKELEKLFSKVISIAGWKADLDVQTGYEQIDVVVHKSREFYLVECKWEKNPIEASVVSELIGKLSKRVLTNGILLSISGFTSGAVSNAQDSTAFKTVLLFGKKDLEGLIADPFSFEILLTEKYNSLISKRKVIYQ